MGTNYYITNHFEDDGETKLHVGKKSNNRAFLFQAYPQYGIFSVEDWYKEIETLGLEDEYGQTVTLQEFASLTKVDGSDQTTGEFADYQDSSGNYFCIGYFN